MSVPDSDRPPSANAADTLDDLRAAYGGLKDALRSARHWKELLTEANRRLLLAEIASVALAIGQDLHPDRDLSDLDVGEVGGTLPADPCPRERLAFLEALWPRLTGALRRIEAAPPRALRTETRVVPAERARRVSPSALLAAARSGDFVPASKGAIAAKLGGRLPRRIAETALVTVWDSPEDRAVKTALTVWARDLAVIAALADVSAVPEVATAARRLRARLRAGYLSRDPWRNIVPLPAMPSTPPPALLRDGAHRLIWDAWRRYRRGFAIDWSSPLFTLPARETWRLYESWCLFAVARALRNLGWRCVSADGFTLQRSGLAFSLAIGNASRLVFRNASGQRLTLTYSRRFSRPDEAGESTGAAQGWHSRSHNLMPDITIEHEGRLLILDAKFKTYAEPVRDAEQKRWRFADANLLPDIQQMHTYRDAIAHGTQRNVVRSAWLLYCGRADLDSPSIVAYPRAAANRPFGDARVGALRLRPHSGTPAATSLEALLADFCAATAAPALP